MSDDMTDLDLQWEEGQGGIEPGDTVTGVIVGDEVRTFETDDGEAVYLDLDFEVDDVGMVLTAGYPAGAVTPSTKLGQLLIRMGATVTYGEPVDLENFIGHGTEVAFEVDTEEGEDQDGESREFLRVIRDSVRPASEADDIPDGVTASVDASGDGAAESDGSGDGDEEENGLREETFQIVQEMEGQASAQVKEQLAENDARMVVEYNEMVDEGTLKETDAGNVIVP